MRPIDEPLADHPIPSVWYPVVEPLINALEVVLTHAPHQSDLSPIGTFATRRRLTPPDVERLSASAVSVAARVEAVFYDELYVERRTGEEGGLESRLEALARSGESFLLSGERGVGKSTTLHYVFSQLLEPSDISGWLDPRSKESMSFHLVDANHHDSLEQEPTGGEVATRPPDTFQIIYESMKQDVVVESGREAGLIQFFSFLLRKGRVSASRGNPTAFREEDIGPSIATAVRMAEEGTLLPELASYEKSASVERCRDVLSFLTSFCNHTPVIALDNIDVWDNSEQISFGSRIRRFYESLAVDSRFGLIVAVRTENVEHIYSALKGSLETRGLRLTSQELGVPSDFFIEISNRRLEFLIRSTDLHRQLCSDMEDSPLWPIKDPSVHDIFTEKDGRAGAARILKAIGSTLSQEDCIEMRHDLLDNYNGSIRITLRSLAALFRRISFGTSELLSLDEFVVSRDQATRARMLRTMAMRHATLFTVSGTDPLGTPPPSMVSFAHARTSGTVDFLEWRICEMLAHHVAATEDWIGEWNELLLKVREEEYVGRAKRLARTLPVETIAARLSQFDVLPEDCIQALQRLNSRRDDSDEGVVRVLDNRFLSTANDVGAAVEMSGHVELLRPGWLLLGWLNVQAQFLFWNAMIYDYEDAESFDNIFDGFSPVDAMQSERLTAIVSGRFLLEVVEPRYRAQFSDWSEVLKYLRSEDYRQGVLPLAMVDPIESFRHYFSIFGNAVAISAAAVNVRSYLMSVGKQYHSTQGTGPNDQLDRRSADLQSDLLSLARTYYPVRKLAKELTRAPEAE